MKVAVLEVVPYEPIILRGSYGRGGHYTSPLHIPAPSLTGALLHRLYSRGEDVRRAVLWASHAYPDSKEFELGSPPPLPLRTLSRAPDGRLVSVALKMAEALKEGGTERLAELDSLDKKVGTVYVRADGSEATLPEREVSTHVTLDFEKRTHLLMGGEGESAGLMYTQEILLPSILVKGSPVNSSNKDEDGLLKYYSLAFLDDDLASELEGGVEVRIGAGRNKGFGLSQVKATSIEGIEEYRRNRLDKLRGLCSKGFLTVDVLSMARPSFIRRLGRPVYVNAKPGSYKAWIGPDGVFRTYKGMIMQGSVYVFEFDCSQDQGAGISSFREAGGEEGRSEAPAGRISINLEDIVEMETTPPEDWLERIHGLDMVFFGNPFHYLE